MTAWRIDTLLAGTVPGWIRDGCAWRTTLELVAGAHGRHHVSLGHLDLKAATPTAPKPGICGSSTPKRSAPP
ncbi:hypothetical protein [Thermomonospora umbrina]|uniref:Uncharacterized protein n=1 Tax=Thermomonospora umbrina TaxID=111806 RepID=A0A3D9T5D4_9ACTN|nr:hypothetical protein [Thermomonospora umbrina]REF00456.1 hypothetical protein DFJ69_5994 [Thermomonospora umbrina]